MAADRDRRGAVGGGLRRCCKYCPPPITAAVSPIAIRAARSTSSRRCRPIRSSSCGTRIPLLMMGRLAPGATVASAQEELGGDRRRSRARLPREQGARRLRRTDAQRRLRTDRAGVARAACGGRTRAADRVRQRGQPAAGARHATPARGGRPLGARRRHAAAGAPVHRRKPAADERLGGARIVVGICRRCACCSRWRRRKCRDWRRSRSTCACCVVALASRWWWGSSSACCPSCSHVGPIFSRLSTPKMRAARPAAVKDADAGGAGRRRDRARRRARESVRGC